MCHEADRSEHGSQAENGARMDDKKTILIRRYACQVVVGAMFFLSGQARVLNTS